MNSAKERLIEQLHAVLDTAELGLNSATDAPLTTDDGLPLAREHQKRVSLVYVDDAPDDERAVMGLDARALEMDVAIVTAMADDADIELRRLGDAVRHALGAEITVDGVEILIADAGMTEPEVSGEEHVQVVTARLQFSLYYRTPTGDPSTFA